MAHWLACRIVWQKAILAMQRQPLKRAQRGLQLMVWLGHGHRTPETEHWQIKLHHCCRHMLARLQPVRHEERHAGLSNSIDITALGRDSSTASSVSLLDRVTCSAWV